MQTRDQKFAIAVYDRVIQHQNNPKKDRYGSMAKSLPVLVRTSGLAQAITFLKSKESDGMNRELLNDLAASLGKANLVNECLDAPLTEYMVLTKDVLAALLWFKRFSVSVLGVGD